MELNFFGKNLRHLRKEKGLTQLEIAEIIGKKQNTIVTWESGKFQPDFDSLKKIIDFLDVRLDDILYSDLSKTHLIDNVDEPKYQGKSAPKSTSNSTPNRKNAVEEPRYQYASTMPKVITVDFQGNDNIVLVPVRARAGYLNGYGDPDFIQTLPAYRLPGLNHGTFRMFEVFGHSMVPTFHESDCMIARYVENFNEIRDNRVYVVVTKDHGVVVKRVVNRISREGKLILNSDNLRHRDDYPPIVVNPEDIMEIWYVVSYLSRQMREPGEMYNRLIDVESRLTLIEAGRKNLPG